MEDDMERIVELSAQLERAKHERAKLLEAARAVRDGAPGASAMLARVLDAIEWREVHGSDLHP